MRSGGGGGVADTGKKSRRDLGQGRGVLINATDRGRAIELIDEAVGAGARQALACQALGLQERSLQRWRQQPADGRAGAARKAPANKLSQAECQAVLAAANRVDCADLTPHQIVPKLADEGVYLASESTVYRLLKANGQGHRRGRSRAPRTHILTTHQASAANELWCWDITWLPTTVKGRYFYWYMVKDVYSRKLVANEVHDCESADNASELLIKGCLRERTAGKPLVLHSDNGSAMKGATMLATMQELGVACSYSRPRVSNDNAYAEALFRTAKYCPMWPQQPFDTLDEARQWVLRFVHWYNEQHRHSALKYVTPGQRHRGQDAQLLSGRKAVYDAAKRANPKRWSGPTRNWNLAAVVYLNPERPRPAPKQKMS